MGKGSPNELLKELRDLMHHPASWEELGYRLLGFRV